MASVIEVKVRGLDRIEDALERAPLRVAKRIMRNALVAAGRIWKDEIASRVRRGPHHPEGGGSVEYDLLANNVSISTSVKSDLEGSVSVGFRSKFYWARYLEFGTGSRDRRRPGVSRAERRKFGGNRMPPFPFLRQSGYSRASAVLDRFEQGVRQALNAEYR
jgi:Bacteriophage HK97-gp10, putative tail-component